MLGRVSYTIKSRKAGIFFVSQLGAVESRIVTFREYSYFLYLSNIIHHGHAGT